MIGIREVNYEDNEYDRCGNTTKAVLELDGINILLCDSCLNELKESMDKFDNTLFCHKCNNFIMSNSGWRYGGSCKKWAATNGKEISEENAGFDYCVDCMQRCRFIRDNMVYKISANDCGGTPCMFGCNNCEHGIWVYIG